MIKVKEPAAIDSSPDTRTRERSSDPSRRRSTLRLPEFRREERREFRYLLAIGTAFALSWLFRLMPLRFRFWLADSSGSAYFKISRTYRENVCANLSVVTQRDEQSPEVLAAARQVFRNSARNFSDLLITPHLSGERFVERVALIAGDWAYLDDEVRAGKGVVIVTAHLGAFDVLGQTLHARGYKLTSVTGRTTARFLFDAVTFLRRSHGASIVEATPSGVRRMIHALRRGECVAFLTDRDLFQNGKPARFFGKATTLPPGPVRIARDTGAPIVPIFSRRIAHSYGITIYPAIRVDKTEDIEGDLATAIKQVVRVLEDAISSAPDQWVMFQRVWPSEPADPVRVFPIGSPLEGEFLERVGAVLPGRQNDRPSRAALRADGPTDRTEAHPKSQA
jgi:KDO2-lipid IV(A) lauroyltransferase